MGTLLVRLSKPIGERLQERVNFFDGARWDLGGAPIDTEGWLF